MKLLKVLGLCVLTSVCLGNGSNYNNVIPGSKSNSNKSGTQQVQYCSTPKIIVKNICKPTVRSKVIYKERIVYKKQKAKIIIKKEIKEVRVITPILKNSIRLLGGVGPTGVSVENVGSKAFAYEDKGAVLGLGYTRRLNRRWSLEGNALTNETFLLGVGFSF